MSRLLKPLELKRVVPARCAKCGRDPYVCNSCGDYQCLCPNPYQLQMLANDIKAGRSRKRVIPRVHYGKDGLPYPAQFLDGFVPEQYPEDSNGVLSN